MGGYYGLDQTGLDQATDAQVAAEKATRAALEQAALPIAGGAVLLTAALASSAVAKWGHSTDPVTVPEHTRIHVVLDQAVSTGTKPGHHFRATVSKPVVIEGKTVIPKGAHAEGVVVEPRKRDDSRVVHNCCSRCNRWTWTGRTIPFAATLPVNLAVAT